MENDDDWVMVGRLREKDLWHPSGHVDRISDESKALKVRFNGPAEYWTDALPIGNGRLGAMVWGGVLSETINLNGKFVRFCYLVDELIVEVLSELGFLFYLG